VPAAVRAGALLAIGLLLWMSGARADLHYLADLQRRAAESRLADHREWRVLLHYRLNGSGGEVMSDADDPRFLAPGGKTDPAGELAATWRPSFPMITWGRSAAGPVRLRGALRMAAPGARF
jgi:hypothetical protein